MSPKASTNLPFTHLPEGTVTFLFTDIEGSTRLLKRLREAYAQVLKDQRALLQESFSKHGGQVVDTRGEEFFVAFQRATDSVAAAVEAQRELAKYDWPEDIQLRVRMGIHTGEPWVQEDGYVGMDVHRAARIANLGHGGQVLLSETTTALVIDDLPEGVNLEDLGRHRMKDVPRMEQIHQLAIDGLPHEFPPLKSLEAELPDTYRGPNHNLPAELTPFIGREDELLTIQSMLRDPSHRLVTLLGVGGMGKTRLALQAAGNMIDQFSDGIWLVEFAKLRDAELVPQHTAAVFDVSAQEAEEGRTVGDVLVSFLRDRELLLVLDNCEHLINACAEFSEFLLKQCPTLKILATSRENLGLASEHTLIVPAMDVPEVSFPLEEMQGYEAMRFFEDRARAALPMFKIIPENANAVVEICRRLDGIPLAIELAAARVKILSPDQITTLLEDRFTLLRGGSRTSMKRHQALQATLEWSYNLLTDTEQHVFTRLAVFAGGWTLEAVEGLLGDDISAEATIFELMSSFVDKSLVTVSHSNGAPRYGMLETVQQYASELLASSGEETEFHQRHAHYFIALAERADPELRSANQMKWLNLLNDEHENFRAALRWLTSADQANDAARLVAALGWFWFLRGYWVESWRWLTAVLDMVSDPEPRLRARAICRAGGLQIIQGNLAGPPDLVKEAYEILSEHNDVEGMAWCLNLFGQLSTFFPRNVEDGIRNLEKSIELFQSLNDEWGVAWSKRYLGQLAEFNQDLDLALALREETVNSFKEIGDHWNAAHSLVDIGGFHRLHNEFTKSEKAYRESYEICGLIGDAVMGVHALQGLGFVDFELGRQDEAKDKLLRALEVLQKIGDENCEYRALYYLARVAVEQGDLQLAENYLRESLIGYRKLDRILNVRINIALYARLADLAGEPMKAAKLLGAALNPEDTPLDVGRQRFLEEFDAQIESLEQQLGKEAFEKLFAEGAEIELDQVVAGILNPAGGI